ncbi:MAG TPA: hypothetical protein VH877_21785 [Polyangia bacterium]|nr:hypothetical protein [Polyangia bacterium]
MGSLGLAGMALAKPKSPSELAKDPVVRTAPRKVVRQTQVQNTQPPRAPGVRVYRDPDTGEIREGTPEETQKLEAQRQGNVTPTLAPPSSLRQITFSDGSVAVELDDSYMTHLIVERAADGTLHMRCKAAGETSHTPPPAAAPATPPRIEME